MSTFSGLKKEVETIVSLKVNKVINKMNLVKRDEFEILKTLVQKIIVENSKLKQSVPKKKKKSKVIKKKSKTSKKTKKWGLFTIFLKKILIFLLKSKIF